MSDSQDVTRVTESIDGAIMEEIGSPDGEHLEEVFIDEPDVALVYDGNIVEDVDLDEEDDDIVETEEVTDPDPEPTEVETVEEFDEEESVEASPEGEAEITPEGASDADAEGASPTTDEPTREPFNYRVDGQDYEVSESYVEDDNIVIPRESWQRDIQPRLADRNAWIAERRQYLQQIEDLSPENNPEVIKANKLLEQLDAAFEDEESAYAFFKNFTSNKDKLFLAADRAAFEAEKQQATAVRDREAQETETRELQTQMDASIDSVLQQAAEIEAYQGVDFDHVRRLIDQTKNSFFFRAAEDLPQFGLKKGEVGLNIQRIESVIQAEAERSNKLAEQQAARRRNDEALGDSTEEEDPAPPAPEPDTPQDTSGGSPEITSKEDWESHIAAVAAGAR